MKKTNYAPVFPVAVALATSIGVALRNMPVGVAIGVAFMALSYTFTRKENSR